MKRILIIEDEQKIYQGYLRSLVESGFIVRQANDARQAAYLLLKEEMDLIVMDIKMVETDGQDIFKVIRKFNPNLDFIISSIYSVEKQKALIPWAQDYHDKSQGIFILIDKIKSVLVC